MAALNVECGELNERNTRLVRRTLGQDQMLSRNARLVGVREPRLTGQDMQAVQRKGKGDCDPHMDRGHMVTLQKTLSLYI